MAAIVTLIIIYVLFFKCNVNYYFLFVVKRVLKFLLELDSIRERDLMQSDLFRVRFLTVSSLIFLSSLKWLKFWHVFLVE